MPTVSDDHLSIVRGDPLESETGLGTLTLPGFIRDVCDRHRDREALVCYADGQRQAWTYDELMKAARKVARSLIAGGFSRGSRVGILMTNRAEWVISAFGVALAGGVVVALNTFATRREFRFFLAQSGLSTLFLEPRVLKHDFLGWLEEICADSSQAAGGRFVSGELPFLERLITTDDADSESRLATPWSEFLAAGEAVSDALVEARSSEITEADDAVVFFSSGSTALPKGIRHNQKAIGIQCWRWARLLELESDVRSWTPNGFFWSGNFCVLLGATLAVGGTVVLQRMFELDQAVDLLEAERISYPFLWPHQMATLSESSKFLEANLGSIKYVNPDWPVAKNPHFRDSGWRYPANSFGCSETITINCSFPASAPAELRGSSSGWPMPGNTLAIMDVQTGQPVPVGERGEIAIKGPTLLSGYLGVPLTDTLDENGFYLTGDGGYIDSKGRLYWEGRLNDVIKTGGANVSPAEVDEVINEFSDKIKVAHTVGVPHSTLGEMVVSCIVPMSGVELDLSALQEFLRERLASYKRPREVLVLEEEDLEFTASAKVKLSALRELAEKRLAG